MRSACSVAWYVVDDVPQVQLHDASHAELVRRAAGQARDRDAEAELCRRFAPRVRLYGLKHLRDEERARDLVQLVLVAMIEAVRAGRVEDPDRFDRFVLGMCRNIMLRTRSVEARAIPTDEAQLDIMSVLPRQDALDLDAMTTCLEQLEQRARTVLHLSFYRDNSADEIAAALHTTAGNVRVVRHRALAQLRDCMGAMA